MKQTFTSHCDCCGLPVNPQAVEDCPRCHYPVSPDKEVRFLESAISDLQRVASYGGANLRVADLVIRYQSRLHTLRQLLATSPAVPLVQQSLAPQVPWSDLSRSLMDRIPIAQEPLTPQVPAEAIPVTPSQSPRQEPAATTLMPESPQPPRHVFSWKSFFADQAINIVASLGAFLILAGALGFTTTTSSLLLSFLVVFAVHAVFGITGFITYRFHTFRVVATIYTIIFALLVPLVGFSAYRLLIGSAIGFSVPVLVAIAAVYAAIVYMLLAVYQRFTPFAYLGMVALVVADLALADALKLAYWWWPCMAMLLAIPALLSIRRPSGSDWPFKHSWSVLRDPVRFVMYAIVAASALALLFTTAYSLFLDAFHTPLREVRFALLTMTLLMLLWASLLIWLARRTRAVIALAYIALLSVLALCYALAFESIGYALALTCVALLYHGLNRFTRRLLQPFGILSLGLDQIALALVFLVPFISSPLLPAQLFDSAYAVSSLHLQTSWRTVAELIAVGLGIILTISVSFSRAGLGKTPLKAAWCWLLLLSGFLLNWEYTIVVLALHIVPVWAFLGLALVMVVGAVVVRRLFGAAWANPLDVLALFSMTLTLTLSLNQTRDVVSILLLSFAALLYIVLLYQQRQNWLFLPLAFALLALPALWDRPLAMLLIGVLLPLASVAIRYLISNRWHTSHAEVLANLRLANMWEWPLLAAGLVYGVALSVHDVTTSTGAFAYALHVNVPVALEVALLSLAWYASAALARVKPWLVPAAGFAIGSLLIPTNSFWVLIGFAALAYAIGVLEDALVAMWIMPVFATWSVIVAAGFLGDLYRPPVVALACAVLGVSIGFLNPIAAAFSGATRKNSVLAYALPFYATALAAAVLTGVYGTLANINRPFYGAVPDAMLLYAVVTFAVLVYERRPGWLWLVAGFGIWGTALALQLTAYYMLGIGIGIAVLGLLVGHLLKQPATPVFRKFTWSWPWYITG